MKKTGLIILLMSIYFSGNAQLRDSLDIVNQQKQIDDIYQRMYDHSEEYRLGTTFLLSGLLLNTVATLMIKDKLNDPYYDYTNSIIAYSVGSGLMITGFVLHIDSHKYFNSR